MENGQYVDGSLWFYAPDKVAPPIFAFLFLASGVCHACQCARYKCWKVTGVYPWSALLFVIGFILREVGAFNYSNIPIYISSTVFLYAGPPVYELANYFVLSRILYYVPYISPIHPGRVLTTFAGLSAIVEALTANGAARVANSSLSQSDQDVGKALLKAALILQLVILCCFILLAASFHRRCKKAKVCPQNLNNVLLTLYLSSALIGIRTIYRTVEYFTAASADYSSVANINSQSPILRYEWFFWVFEAVMMVTNTYLLNLRHPMTYLPRNNNIYLAMDGTTEIEGDGYHDTRPWYVTVFDPFDIGGIFKGRNMNQRFWDTHPEGKPAGNNNAGATPPRENDDIALVERQ